MPLPLPSPPLPPPCICPALFKQAGEEGGATGKGAGTGGDGGGGAGAFAEGGMVAGPISLLGYLRVEVFGAEDHGVVDTQVGSCVAAVVCGCTCIPRPDWCYFLSLSFAKNFTGCCLGLGSMAESLPFCVVFFNFRCCCCALHDQANRTVRNFLTVPRQLERLLLFGMLVCLDTFLYVTTFLPIRIVIGLVTTLFSVITRSVATLFRSCTLEAI